MRLTELLRIKLIKKQLKKKEYVQNHFSDKLITESVNLQRSIRHIVLKNRDLPPASCFIKVIEQISAQLD